MQIKYANLPPPTLFVTFDLGGSKARKPYYLDGEFDALEKKRTVVTGIGDISTIPTLGSAPGVPENTGTSSERATASSSERVQGSKEKKKQADGIFWTPGTNCLGQF